ncbi:hypothetical protein MCEMSHM24_02680 [Comamonadaceae bacterium]
MEDFNPAEIIRSTVAALRLHCKVVEANASWMQRIEDGPIDQETQIVLRWISTYRPTYSEFAKWANAQGFKLEGRRYTHTDIAEIIQSPPEGWNSELIRFCVQLYWTERRKLDAGEII